MGSCSHDPTGVDPNLSFFTREDAEVRPGVIRYYDVPMQIEVPGDARAGESVRVTVSVLERLIRVEPFDTLGPRVPRQPRNLYLGSAEHEVSFVLSQPGSATIEFRGWALPEDEPITVRRGITVR